MSRKSYNVEMPIAIALTTERIEFLSRLTDDELKDEITVDLLKDLIEDRVKLRKQIMQAAESLKSLRGLMEATLRRYDNLQDYLEGRDPESDD